MNVVRVHAKGRARKGRFPGLVAGIAAVGAAVLLSSGTAHAASGTVPAGAAFEANTTDLWTTGDAGTTDLGLRMMPGTSPSIARVGTGYQEAFQANTGVLWVTGVLGTRNFGLGMMSGTSPAITAVTGGYEVAFQAITGTLWVAGTQRTASLGLGMKAGSSPSIASCSGGYSVAFQANTGTLWTTGSVGTRNTSLGMAARTSPAIACGTTGYGLAFQANTGNLWAVGAAGSGGPPPGNEGRHQPGTFLRHRGVRRRLPGEHRENVDRWGSRHSQLRARDGCRHLRRHRGRDVVQGLRPRHQWPALCLHLDSDDLHRPRNGSRYQPSGCLAPLSSRAMSQWAPPR